MKNSAAALMKKRYGKLLPADKIFLPLSPMAFWKIVLPILVESSPSCRASEITLEERTLKSLYLVYLRAIELLNRIATSKHAPKTLRFHLKNYRSVQRSIRRIIQEVNNSRELLGPSAKELKVGVLDFAGIREQLLNLHKQLGEIQADCALLIAPCFRKQPEKILANQSKNKIKHIANKELRANAAVLQNQVVKQLASVLPTLRKKSGVPTNYNLFISQFLEDFFQESISENYVNVILRRRRARDKTREKSCE